MVAFTLGRGSRSVRLLILLVLFASVTLPNSALSWALEQLPVATVVDLASPSEIMAGESFTVTVTVDYSGSYSTDIAILDVATGFVLASKGLIIPAGTNVFTFPLTGPDRPGVWMLAASVRVWWHDGWYASQNGATFPFVITVSDPTSATLVVTSNLVLAEVTLDGASYFVSSKGIELSTQKGLHTIEAKSPPDMSNETRAVFDHWSDGIRSSLRKIYLAGRLDLSAIYTTEYLLNVKSSLGKTVGSGWYPAGMNASFALASTPVTKQAPNCWEASYKFSSWSGDAESTSPVGWVLMDRPKTVVANWSEDNSQLPIACLLLFISAAFLSLSGMLIAIAVIVRRRSHQRPSHALHRRKIARGLTLSLFLLIVIAHSTSQAANAFIPIQPETITIGDAAWYHWNEATSDTLLVWLGGGIVAENTILVNPYQFESYNTVRFVQDLASHYDVIALKKGSTRYSDPTLNRTAFCEPYPGSIDFLKAIRSWAREQGYMYLYVVGYSVGAMAAAQELVLANPSDWISPDGLVIITTKMPEAVSSSAASLRASLLMLYGDRVAREFTDSGESFFRNAPEEGWRGGHWYHKEYHLIPDVEHEVWTIMDSGEYDERAVLLVVKFIEREKGLQFEPVRENILQAAMNRTSSPEPHPTFKLDLISPRSPANVGTDKVFGIIAEGVYNLPPNSTVAMVMFDNRTRSVQSAAQRRLSGTGQTRFVITLVTGDIDETLHLVLVPLIAAGDSWTVLADEIADVIIDVTKSFALTLITGYSDVPVELDGTALRTGVDGRLTIGVSAGEHVVSVPGIMRRGETSRAVFQQWNDTVSPPTLRIDVSHDMSVLAVYRTQYCLNVTSQFGQATGTGWYDEYATAWFHVMPTLVHDKTVHLFAGWLGDSADSSPSSSIFMNGPKSIRASWRDPLLEQNVILIQLEAIFILSIAILFGSIIFLVSSLRRERRTELTNLHGTQLESSGS